MTLPPSGNGDHALALVRVRRYCDGFHSELTDFEVLAESPCRDELGLTLKLVLDEISWR